MHFPLSDSTQWELTEQVADSVYPIIGSLEKKSAQGKITYNDDTPLRIPDWKRTGMFTTEIVKPQRKGTTEPHSKGAIIQAGRSRSPIRFYKS
jgi:hypothetical protein